MSRHPEDTVRLARLTPAYLAEHHSRYVKYLESAVTGSDPARNVALAGAYSAGKSSILQGLKERLSEEKLYRDKLVEVSLTNLGPAERELSESKLGTLLQKEVVKRLLYSASPNRLPLSRFKRIVHFRFWLALFVAVSVVLLLLAGVTLVVGPEVVAQVFASDGLDPALAVLLAVLCAVLIGMFLQRFLHGNRLSEVAMGPASLKLSHSGGTYFDEYLDELVYFFQSTGKRFVIFEDLDRFDHPGIFQSLRDLNNLLNAAELIRDPIVFVYAVRDSLFELGKKPPKGGTNGSHEKVGEETEVQTQSADTSQDEENAAASSSRYGVDSPASDRAKFFDLIVPVIPFISHSVASDLMLRELERLAEADRPSPDLVALAGRHFTDMRVILSIANEFAVFTEELLKKSKVEGLNKNHQFAMVLYKHIDLEDFERIRVGKSKLDKLVTAISGLTEERLRVIDRQIALLRDEAETERRAASVRVKMAKRLRAVLEVASRVPARYSARVERLGVGLRRQPFSLDQLDSTEFWSALSQDSTRIDVQLSGGHSYEISQSDIEALFDSVDPLAHWTAQDSKSTQSHLARLQRLRRKLATSTFTQRVNDESFSGLGIDEEHLSMPAETRSILGDSLALDLVRAGFIDHNFALYTTTYYGDLLSPAARSFILQVLDRHRSDPQFRLDKRDVEQLIQLREVDLLRTSSGLNFSLFDHLIEDPRLGPTLELISAGALDQEHGFVHAFMATSSNARRLVERLAPSWAKVLDVVAGNERIDQKEKVKLIDAALARLKQGTDYVVGESTRQILAQHLDEMSVLRKELPEASARALARLLGENSLVVKSLANVQGSTRHHIAEHQAFDITKENLEAITPKAGRIGLDTFVDSSTPVSKYLIAEAKAYTAALSESGSDAVSVDDPGRLPDILALVADLDGLSLDKILTRASPEAMVDDISSVPVSTWGSLARTRRFALTLQNLHDYLLEGDEDGRYDALSTYLEAVGKFRSTDKAIDEQKFDVARWIVNQAGPSVKTKLKLLAQLELPGPLLVADLTVKEGSLLAGLISAGHIEDSAETFQHFNHLPWKEREPAFAASACLHEFIRSVELSSQDLLALVRSPSVPVRPKTAILHSLEAFVDRLTRVLASDLARLSVAEDIELTASQMLILAQAGAPSAPIAKLLGRRAAESTDSEIVTVLSGLEGEYQKLSSAKGQQPKLPDNADIRALLERLKEMNLVSSVRDEDDGHIRVAMKRQGD